ncbi:MAG: protein kinase family protein [Chloroflexi bacterium]|nr:protein kinase family protein [Chloroflexota bacterium]
MTWPNSADYNQSLQHPHLCFQDPDLKQGKVLSVDQWGIPRGSAGSYARVYEFQNSKLQKIIAVRCFTIEVTDQQQRYYLLKQYLGQTNISSLVEFDYRLQGISIKGQIYPILCMEYVKGKSLDSYIEENLRNPKLLEDLAEHWYNVIIDLRRARIAHGDLQHGNILIDRNGRIRLVDYDGMFTPNLQNQKPNEFGHLNYQHPKRASIKYYSEDMDNFSALVIYLSILALSSDSNLWKEFKDDENLLFKDQDFNKIGQTNIWYRLKQNSNPKVVFLTSMLEKFCGLSIDTIPSLSEINYTSNSGTQWYNPPKLDPSRSTTNRNPVSDWYKQAPQIRQSSQPVPDNTSWLERVNNPDSSVANLSRLNSLSRLRTKQLSWWERVNNPWLVGFIFLILIILFGFVMANSSNPNKNSFINDINYSTITPTIITPIPTVTTALKPTAATTLVTITICNEISTEIGTTKEYSDIYIDNNYRIVFDLNLQNTIGDRHILYLTPGEHNYRIILNAINGKNNYNKEAYGTFLARENQILMPYWEFSLAPELREFSSCN